MLTDAIDTFATGTYTVKRAAAGTMAAGVWTPGGTVDLSVTASVQPARGRDLIALPEGRRTEDVQVVYTTTQLLDAATGPDVMMLGAEPWEVIKAEQWPAFEGHYTRAFIARQVAP